MKAKFITIAIALGLLATIGGAFLLTSQGQTPVGASVKFDPNFVEWDSNAPSFWYAEIRAAAGFDWNPRDVDGSTVELMGIPAIGGYYATGTWHTKFLGSAVWNKLLGLIYHMGELPQFSTKVPIKFWLTVTGKLIDGTDFEGQGWIAIRFVHGLPDPPPLP